MTNPKHCWHKIIDFVDPVTLADVDESEMCCQCGIVLAQVMRHTDKVRIPPTERHGKYEPAPPKVSVYRYLSIKSDSGVVREFEHEPPCMGDV